MYKRQERINELESERALITGKIAENAAAAAAAANQTLSEWQKMVDSFVKANDASFLKYSGEDGTVYSYISRIRDESVSYTHLDVYKRQLQDAEKGAAIFERIKKLAVISPFRFKDLISYTKQLSAFSVPYEELYDTTKMLADLSAGLGVSMERLLSLIHI